MRTSPVIIGLIAYAYSAFVLQSIAYKTRTPNGWWAWIPIVQNYLFVKIAKKSDRWFWAVTAPILFVFGALLFYVAFRDVVFVRFISGILFFVGIVGGIAAAIIGIILWANIIKIFGKSAWLVILLFIPVVGFVFLSYLAFAPSAIAYPSSSKPINP